MPILKPYVRLTPTNGGTALDLPPPDDVSRDQLGNVTFQWRDPISSWSSPARVVLSTLESYLSDGVEQKRNRDNAFLAITNREGSLQTVSWTEVDPWTGAIIGPYSLVGVVTLGSYRSSRQEDGLTLIAYKATYRYSRGTGTYEAAP